MANPTTASTSPLRDGIASGRLPPEQLARNFADLHPPLDDHEALVAADRCYFCYDAPCQTACPTSIDIPLFIREISTGNPLGAAETIFDQNILGGMCARVCPTETLCEEACVRETAEGRPVEIGRLQRYATDLAIETGRQFYTRAAPTGKKVAVVGAGPAGLACAHRLAMNGHEVTILDAKQKPGGLNEYGIASYKAVGNFAQKEVDWLLAIGGISIKTGVALGRDVTVEDLTRDYDAVFLGLGLTGVNALRTIGEGVQGVQNAVDFIAALRQTTDLSALPVGRHVVVVGGGMTAVDAAVQARLLGATEVTICYRRGRDQMSASAYEQDLATSKGVVIRHNAQPREIHSADGRVTAIEMEITRTGPDGLEGTGETFILPADQVFKAIGQTFEDTIDGGIALKNGRIATDPTGRTSNAKVWAGGDCVHGGDDLTVSAVAMGRDAADAINLMLKS